MSTVEQAPASESRSSIALTRNAKGETQVAVKIYSTDESAPSLARMEQEAADVYDRLCTRYRNGVAA